MTTAITSPTSIRLITAEDINELYALRWKKLIELHQSTNGLCIAKRDESGKISCAGDLFDNVIDSIDEQIEIDQTNANVKHKSSANVRESENYPTVTYREVVSKIEAEGAGRLCQDRANFNPETQFSSKSEAFESGVSDGSILCAREIRELIRQLGEVTVTISEGSKEVVAVTRQDDDHRILSVIWMKNLYKDSGETIDQ